ncbi:MAG TPA: RHS repeat-associated core domain-containing protein [Kofleriaceae bacterium]|nr:RHS repeat-associated core domain-containing protein [Kofleriaceae bacterium]
MPQRPVVARITKVSGFGQAEEQTSFIYTQPVLGKASAVDPRAPSFLGFQQVTVARSGQQGPASARTVKSFDYTPLLADRSGRLASELTSRAEGLAQVPVSHKQLTYGARNVGSTSASFTYVADEIDRVCEPTATAEACAAQPPTKTTTQIWSAGLAGAVPQLWLNTETETTVGLQVRFTARTYDVRWSDTIAHVLPAMEQSGAIAVIPVGNGALRYPVPLTRTLTLYSAAGLPEETRTYKDAATYVTTKYSYHSTGMLLTVKRPNEVAANHFASESTRYNEFLLHPTAYVNQGNQYTYVSYDTATGALLSRTGPSYRMTATPGVYVTDRETWSIDGFGRVISRSDSLEPAAGVAGYDFRTVETVQYFDAELPNRRLTSRLRDPAANTWVRDEARLDGSGRVIEEIARRQLAGEPDARKLYTYDAGGALARIDETSPASGAGGALVATVFTRDGVGRPLTITRPDGSGETIRYAGLDTEVTEQSSTDPGARTTLRNDGFAELVEVHEHDNPLAGQTAITRYQRDALGRMSTIVDADGGTTMIAHDWRGARAAVTRGARAWRYTYDANGNMIEQSEPVPTGGTPADYKMVTTYDRLNRPMTVTPPTRGMSAARLAQLGLGVTTYAYDGNGFVGKPHQITLPFGTITLAYEANGRVARETRNLALSEGVSVTTTQWVERRYDALGNPTSTRWDDGTEWRYTHDTRGQVSDVLWRPATGGKLVTLAHYDRQATGQPTRRTSEYPQQRTWSYDVLGRVSYDRVFNTATNASYHERTYGYDGFGSLRSVQGATGGMLADATHDFDARHRVIAAQGPLGYDASFSYSGAGNVRTAAVVGASDAPDRDVNYLYSAADPQAVELLSDRTTGAAVGSYVYDAAGNTVQRTIGASTRNFTWGGNGMLREVTGPEGTERYYFGPEAQRMVALGPDGVKVWFGESETSFTNTGAFVRRYHHVASGEPVARSVRSTPTAAHTLELQYADALSNLAVAVNTNGTLTAAFVYGAFGELVGATGAADHRRAFNGKEHDVATGLRHYGYRSYDPVSLRWASADPLFRFAPDAAWTTPQHANLYAFSLNNPLQYMDPDGRRPGYTRSWSGDAPKNATEWTYSDVAKCPKKGVCQIDVIHDHRLDATHFDLGGVHVVGYTMIRTMFTITVVDGVVQNEPEVTIPYDQDVYRETVGTRGGRIVDYEVAKLAETTVGWTSTLTITGNKVSLAIEASGGSKQQQSGTTMHLDGSVEKIVGLAGGANKSSGESRDIHSGSRGKTGLLFNVQTVSPGEWNRLATERMEGPFIGEPRL